MDGRKSRGGRDPRFEIPIANFFLPWYNSSKAAIFFVYLGVERMELNEKTLSSEKVFDGRLLKIFRDTVELVNGGTAFREIVRHPGGVAVVPLDNDGNVHLVRQFRCPYGRAVTEIPAGKLEPGEEPFAAIQRELEEEIGAVAAQWDSLGEAYPSPGYTDEVLHLYLARGLTFGETHLDEDEFLEHSLLPLDQAVEQAANGQFQDAKTAVALLRTWYMLHPPVEGM